MSEAQLRQAVRIVPSDDWGINYWIYYDSGYITVTSPHLDWKRKMYFPSDTIYVKQRHICMLVHFHRVNNEIADSCDLVANGSVSLLVIIA